MSTELWTRRKVLKTGATLATGAAVSGSPAAWAAAQLPAPELLQDDHLTFITTTEASAWQQGSLFKPSFAWETLNLNIDAGSSSGQVIEGVGGCFNELGWTSLQALSEADRESVLHELFHPTAGACFTYCRMPIGANDFATEAYSYDETDGDFELKHFSIEHDRNTLVPFIKAALRHQPGLRLWASLLDCTRCLSGSRVGWIIGQLLINPHYTHRPGKKANRRRKLV